MASLLSPRAPLWCCPFRPFFLLTALHGIVVMAVWLAWLSGWMPLPDMPGGPFVWHAHEMLFGFAAASIAGFLLTALTEFTGSAALPPRPVQRLVWLWLGGRVAYLLSGSVGIAWAAALDMGFMLSLVAHSFGPLWRAPERRHMSFFYALVALTGAHLGFYISLLLGHEALPWLRLSIGLLMILVIVALSRISMALFNEVMGKYGGLTADYVARPPRRNLALFTIGLSAVATFAQAGPGVSGWLACAAAAAILNLLNDWHVGRALWQRWVLIPYLLYWCMALGYGVIGVGHLSEQPWQSAGEHLLLVAALGLAILVVMSIAGRVHAGHALDGRLWLPAAVLLLILAAISRAGASLPLLPLAAWGLSPLTLAAVLWIGAWLLYAVYAWRVLTGPRPDLGQACDERIPLPSD